MNIHHLELFYYVATHRGIGQAVRHMPYGIQQPAVSSQLIELEKGLNTILFQRRPFALTPAGEELFHYIAPFFSQLPQMTKRLSGHSEPLLRLASTPTIIRNHIPPVLKKVRKKFKDFRLAIREIQPNQAEPLLRSREIDMAVAFWDRKPVGGIKFQKLGSLNMAILVPEASGIKTAEQAIREAEERATGLISLPSETVLTKSFQQELGRRGIAWKQTIEVNSLDLIQTYALDGFGFGLSVEIPQVSIPSGLRLLPLSDFPALIIGIFWMGKMAPVAEEFTIEMQRHVTALLQRKA